MLDGVDHMQLVGSEQVHIAGGCAHIHGHNDEAKRSNLRKYPAVVEVGGRATVEDTVRKCNLQCSAKTQQS
jgi:hypothetical protein